MNILVTGAEGFVGKNLVEALKCIRSGKDRTRPALEVNEIYCFDVLSKDEELEYACKNADFVFNFAGVNRPLKSEEFLEGNFGFADKLLNTLKNIIICVPLCCRARFRQV